MAIKKLANAFHNLGEMRRTYREIVLMRHLQHENLLCLTDLFVPTHADFDDIYMVLDARARVCLCKRR